MFSLNAKHRVTNRQYLIILIVLGAAAVRVLTLPSVGCLSFDEAWSVWVAQKDLTSALSAVAQDKHPPLFYVLLYFWIRLVGASEFSLRLPSAFAGLACVGLIYRVGRELFGYWTGVLAALLITAAPFQLWYSQEARMYSLCLAFSLLSVFFLWKAREQNERRYWAGFTLVTLLLVLTHYVTGLLLLGEGIFLLWEAARDRKCARVLKKWLLSMCTLVVVALPWLPRLLAQISIDSGPPPWIAKMYGAPTYQNLYQTIFHDFFLWSPQFYPRWLRLVTYFAITALLCVAIVKFRTRFPFVKLTPPAGVLLCIFCLVLPIGALWLISQAWPMYIPRYLLAFSGFLYLLLSWGLQTIPNRWGRISGATFLVVTLTVGSTHIVHWQRERDWKTITAYVMAHWQEGDALALTPPANWIVFNYYTGGRIPHDLAFYHRLYPSYPDSPTGDELASTLLEQPLTYRRLWWIDEEGTGLAAEWEADPEQIVPRFLDDHFSQQEVPSELSSKWGNVLLYRLDIPEEAAR